tara:strand:+ start:125269 stop:126924 length:1656 start_codon:yes stop_codon:yes gene_type:complete
MSTTFDEAQYSHERRRAHRCNPFHLLRLQEADLRFALVTKLGDATGGLRCLRAVFVPALLVIGFLVSAGISSHSAQLVSALRGAITDSFGWVYLGSMTALLIFALLLAFSSFGRHTLGPSGEEHHGAEPDGGEPASDAPAYSRPTWFAMIFCAGTGVQLVYASVSEPLLQLAAPPFGRTGSQDSLLNAMNISMFHWALHPWAAFAVVALCIGYFAHRRGLPLALSSAFWPLIGDRIYGPIGRSINALGAGITIVAVLSGLLLAAPALGSGLHQLGCALDDISVQLLVVVGISVAAAASLALGRGLRRLCELNLLVVGAMLLFVLVAGQTTLLASSFLDNVWAYLSYLPSNAKELGIANNATESRWLETWTIPYWVWAIAWAPAVGLFIARISRGRTIREVVIAVVIAPALLNALWLATFANSAFYEQAFGDGMLGFAKSGNQVEAVFEMLGSLPWPTLGIVLAIVSMMLFAITSTSAAAFSLSSAMTRNEANASHRTYIVVALGSAAVFAVLVQANALLESVALALALPLCLLLLAMCAGLLRALFAERAR